MIYRANQKGTGKPHLLTSQDAANQSELRHSRDITEGNKLFSADFLLI